jgi:recombination protein RecT
MAEKDTSSARDLMVQDFRNDLTKVTHYLEKLLPFKGGVQKFVEMVNLAILRDMSLLQCNRKSLLLAILWCAQKDLEPGVDDGAWLIPFKGIVVPVPAYKGLIKKATETESVKDVQPFPVFANDTFEYGLGLTPYIDHKPPKLGAPRGDLIGVYVIITMPDMTKRFWVMDRADVEAIRNSSAAYKAKPNEGPWHDWFEKMAMKTVIKQGLKYIPVKPPVRDLLEDDGRMEAGESVATLLRQSGAELDGLEGEDPAGTSGEAPEPDTSAFDKLVAEKNLGTIQKKHLDLFLKETVAAQKKVKTTVAQLKVKATGTILHEESGEQVSRFPNFWLAFEQWEAGRFPKKEEPKKEPLAINAGGPPPGEAPPAGATGEPVVEAEIVEEGPGEGEGESAGEGDPWPDAAPERTFEQEQGDLWNIVIQKGIPLKDIMAKVAVKNMADITPENIASVKAFVTSWEPARKGKN